MAKRKAPKGRLVDRLLWIVRAACLDHDGYERIVAPWYIEAREILESLGQERVGEFLKDRASK
jgi:hypothetical protein